MTNTYHIEAARRGFVIFLNDEADYLVHLPTKRAAQLWVEAAVARDAEVAEFNAMARAAAAEEAIAAEIAARAIIASEPVQLSMF